MKANLIHKDFPFEVAQDLEIKVSDDGKRASFTGYASTFGNKDLQGDIIAEGAFAKAVKAAKPIIILNDHNASIGSVIGFASDLNENKRGLVINVELNTEKRAGKDAYEMLKQAKEVGYPAGLSIGFSIDDYEWNEKTSTRTIKEATLWETSLVVFPANPKATVTSVKSILESGNSEDVALLKRDIETHLREAKGFSKAEATAFVSAGWGVLGDQGNDSKAAAEAISGLADRIKTGD